MRSPLSGSKDASPSTRPLLDGDSYPEDLPVNGSHPAVTLVKTDPTSPGRPKIYIDETTLYELALTHASYMHMGRILGVSGALLQGTPEYRELILKARAVKKNELLAAQFSAAITDRNPTMLIWMGKQYLGQKDVQRVENTGAEGGPQKHEVAYKAVAYFPSNGRNTPLPHGSVTTLAPDGSKVNVPAELVADGSEPTDADGDSADYYRDADM